MHLDPEGPLVEQALERITSRAYAAILALPPERAELICAAIAAGSPMQVEPRDGRIFIGWAGEWVISPTPAELLLPEPRN